jgi:acetone carboxylase gamma subunit
MMNPDFQAKMREFYPKEDGIFWTRYYQRVCEKSVPMLGIVFSRTVKDCLHDMLNDMENLSLDILEEAATGAG